MNDLLHRFSWFSKDSKGISGKPIKTQVMEYRKKILNSSTVGLIKDRLNRLTSNSIFKIETTWGNQNPTKKNVVFGPNPLFHRNRTVQIRKERSLNGDIELFISTDGIGWYGGTSFHSGDIFYLGNDTILVKSGKPDDTLKKIYLTKITLLSRSDAPGPMSAYRDSIRAKINMNCYYRGMDRLSVPDAEVDKHIAFLDKNKGKDIENPLYPYS